MRSLLLESCGQAFENRLFPFSFLSKMLSIELVAGIFRPPKEMDRLLMA